MDNKDINTMLLEINAEKDITIRLLKMKVDQLTNELNMLKEQASKAKEG